MASARRGSPLLWLRSHVAPFLLAGLVVAGPACAPAEHALLLEVRSQADVDTLHVEIIHLDGSSPPTERMERVNRTRDSINNAEPIRIAVSFPGPANVVVYVRAESGDVPPRTLLATRCYAIAGVVRDDVLLVQLDTSVDEDGDGFPRQASATCRDLAPDGSSEACDLGACMDAVAADCDDDPTDDPAGASEAMRNRAADRYPGASFFCMDGVDQNCRIDDPMLAGGDEPCEDRDDDMWQACSLASSSGLCDCDDTNPGINPDALDECGDGIDSDCSGAEAYCDLDGDGVPANVPVGGAPDCDDTDPLVSPAADEDCDNAIDDNCNGLTNEGCSDGDLDNDGHVACMPGVTTCTTCDCNDCNSAVNPDRAEICDGIDNVTGAASADCPGDGDRDGYVPPIDCSDTDPHIYQLAPERCGDATSENCVDPPMACSEGIDADMDSYTSGTRGQDCNDSDPAIAPWATEVCNLVDDDCDGMVNEHGRALDDGGCVFDPRLMACGASGACEVDFRAAMGSIDHCGSCGFSCNTVGATTVADRCVTGGCDCSTEGSPTDIAACAVGSTCCTIGANPGCANLQMDADNCGFCGMICDGVAAPNCVTGACTCASEGAPCATGLACCGAGCVDLTSDNMNCGYCGHVCGGGSTCNAGACTCTSADLFDCNGDIGNPTNDGCEASLNLVSQCGACGRTCMTANVAAATCGGGPGTRACAITSCTAPFSDCDGRASNGCEVDLSTTSNCRACGTVCSPMNATPACEAGGCGYSSCNAGFGDCDGNRVNGCETRLDTTSNCRSCGTVCSPMNATAACEAGGCGFSACATDFGNCDGNRVNGCETAVNTATRCGACGTDCNALANVGTVGCGGIPGGRVCTISSCDANFGNCDSMVPNGCETALRSTANCTACGDVCAIPNASESCASGTCSMVSCDAGFGDCTGAAGCETPLRTVTNCTACGDACVLPNATETCSSGTCAVMSCDAGFADCGPGAGCETTLRTTANCTACGDACNLPNATESCATGTCLVTACDANFDDCTGAPGCETPLRTTTNCTACGDACSFPNAAASCATGTCVMGACNAGFGDCTAAPGCETDLRTAANCGACGNGCGTDTGTGTATETCVDTGGGTYRCRCGGTTAGGATEACMGSSLCCAAAPDCRMGNCM